jgi:dTDP-4-dehydrorhamnose 3,5-epimerase
VAVELSAENGRQLLVPRGFAHGFCTLVDNTLIMYKVDNYYDKSVDFSVAFDDPALAVAWPVGRDRAVLSDKDQKAGPLSALPQVFTFGEQY